MEIEKYLHDDLQSVNLSIEITLNPPVILFPKVKRNSKIPIDIEEELIGSIEATYQCIPTV